MTTLHLPGDEPQPQPDGPERVPLVRLAALSGPLSAAVLRVVPRPAETAGPSRVSVAAFQSSV